MLKNNKRTIKKKTCSLYCNLLYKQFIQFLNICSASFVNSLPLKFTWKICNLAVLTLFGSLVSFNIKAFKANRLIIKFKVRLSWLFYNVSTINQDMSIFKL